ncbi:hypothetical protein PTKIN_Ptkin10aG0024500 [Pterospermum kingtungense]
MDNNNGMVDVSCFLLVEDSGDSELDCGPKSMEIAAADHEDDAESCCCDTISIERLDDFYEETILQLDEDVQDFIDCEEALGYISADQEVEDDEDPWFGINLCREVMDGMEDMMFWETCMAVGYP